MLDPPVGRRTSFIKIQKCRGAIPQGKISTLLPAKKINTRDAEQAKAQISTTVTEQIPLVSYILFPEAWEVVTHTNHVTLNNDKRIDLD